MAWQRIKDWEGKLYIPDVLHAEKKHACPDCFACQCCSAERCSLCKGKKQEDIKPSPVGQVAPTGAT
jgi:hypothetical protein